MMTSVDLLKSFLDDLLRQRWGDLVGMFLILLGVWLVMHGANEVIVDTGKSLIATGLITLRPKTMTSTTTNGNGNGSSSTTLSTTTTKSSDSTPHS